MEKGDPTPTSGQSSRGLFLTAEAYSFLIFVCLTAIAISAFYAEYPIFLLILVLDAVATIANSDALAAADRSVYFLTLVLLSVTLGPYSLPILFLEVLLVIAALDFSFLLRKMRGTVVDAAPLLKRLESYAYTILPAFLASYLLTFLYYPVAGASETDPLPVLAISSAVALLAIYSVSRHLSREGPRGAQPSRS